MDYDVVVAGSGPVGLMLACELRLAGVSVLVVDRLTEPAGHDRAGVLHTRTVECLDIRGLLEGFKDGTDAVSGLPFAGIFSKGLDHATLDTGHPYSLLVPQSRTEELLAARAAELGVPIRRGHEVVAVRQDPDGVSVGVRTADGGEEIRAAYLVGCDGGRSTVRRLADIPFPGFAASVSAMIGYVTLNERTSPAVGSGPRPGWWCSPSRLTAGWAVWWSSSTAATTRPPGTGDSAGTAGRSAPGVRAGTRSRRTSVVDVPVQRRHPSGRAVPLRPGPPRRGRRPHPLPDRRTGTEHRCPRRHEPGLETRGADQRLGTGRAARLVPRRTSPGR
ncbi:hypothetical protein SHKM778_47160 [Streptomyces sp. KM77-8]|uniref:FAD-binding domain-containing protein n=1 Tax=Streptomyces haneummycinicus TaxID=3074435 RepID=A0AAT9HLL5_9ACTN